MTREMVLPIALIVAGIAAMIFGLMMLYQWNSGRGWLDNAVSGTRGASKNDRQYMDLYFVAIVLAPLLGGAIAIILGLRDLLPRLPAEW